MPEENFPPVKEAMSGAPPVAKNTHAHTQIYRNSLKTLTVTENLNDQHVFCIKHKQSIAWVPTKNTLKDKKHP